MRDDSCIIDTSDWHMGDGGAADDFNEAGALWILEKGLLYRPVAFGLVGDIFERWQCRLSRIILAHLEFLKRAEEIIVNGSYEVSPNKRLTPDIYLTDGNHDSHLMENVAELRKVWPKLTIYAAEDRFNLLGWEHLHGHQFDPQNRAGWFQPIAHGLTWTAGMLERITGGLDEGKLNPESWVSPAHDLNVSARGDIRGEILTYVEKTRKRVCYGHTHEVDISRDKMIVNSGCCVGGRASFAALFADGDAVIEEKL